MFWRLIVCLFCIIYLSESSNKVNNKLHEKTDIILEQFEFDIFNKEILSKLNYSRTSKNKLWVEFMLTKNVTQFSVNLSFDMIKKDNRSMNLMKSDFDGCLALELAYSKIIAIKLAMMELMRTSNIPRKCPVMANKLFYVKNYTINAKDYPNIIPAMNWRLIMKFYIGKAYQGKMIMKGEVIKY